MSDFPYNDIIDLPHYNPQHHPRMSSQARAAQFAPFAALTGYDEAINETAQRHNSRSDEPIVFDEGDEE